MIDSNKYLSIFYDLRVLDTFNNILKFEVGSLCDYQREHIQDEITKYENS